MGVTIDHAEARGRLAEAVELAESDEPLPAEWLDAATIVGLGPAKTYTPALGTALLARATDDRIDAVALKVTTDPASYSARGVAHEVLVPAAVEYGFDLRTTGREPLNNQPFFRYLRVDAAERVRYSAFHESFVATLEGVNALDCQEAFAALAAFLRVAFGRARARTAVDLRGVAVGLRAAIEATVMLLREDAEEGKRAQAVVAATFDLVYGEDRVRTRRVNDPSRRFPGDVQALDMAGLPLTSVEVRAKPVPPTEVEQFARSLAEARIARGMVVALSPAQARLDAALTVRIAQELGVLMTVVDTVDELLLTAFAWSPTPLAEALREYPERVSVRLQDMEVTTATATRWGALVRAAELEAQPSIEGGA